MHYYQFNIAAWALHTSHLTLEEECIYRRLIDYYYDTESPIPEETKPVIRRLRLISHEPIVKLILQEFFHLEADGWHNSRADIEIADYKLKANKARENGKKGGRPKQNKAIETESVILANQEETTLKSNYKLRTINYELETNSLVTPQAATPKKLAKRLPDDWKPDKEYWEAAKLIKPDMTQEWFIQVAHKFKDYWIAKAGKDATKADWLATWRNWIRREAENAKGGIGTSGKKSYGEQRSELFDSVTDYGRATNF